MVPPNVCFRPKAATSRASAFDPLPTLALFPRRFYTFEHRRSMIRVASRRSVMRILACLSLLGGAIAAPATAVDVQTASGDWSKLPQMSQRGYDHLSEKMQAKLFEIGESKQCPSFTLNQGRLNVRI